MSEREQIRDKRRERHPEVDWSQPITFTSGDPPRSIIQQSLFTRSYLNILMRGGPPTPHPGWFKVGNPVAIPPPESPWKDEGRRW